jgi:cytochrome c
VRGSQTRENNNVSRFDLLLCIRYCPGRHYHSRGCFGECSQWRGPHTWQGPFEKRCGGCHSLDAAKEGPPLRGVYGRKAGSILSFKYSDALKGAQFAWDQNSLDKWLTNTESVVPDNDMDFHVPKSDERADIIEYLRVSSGR